MKKQVITTTDGKRCAYVSEDRGLPKLICIHGGMGLSSDSLIPGLNNLSLLFDLVFIDLRGCGDSAKASRDTYTLEEFATDINEIVNAVAPKGLKGILGHSLGGMVAIKSLAMYPNLFDFAILANTAMDDSWREAASLAVQKLNDPQVEITNQKYGQQPESDSLIRDVAICYGPIYFPELNSQAAKQAMEQFTYRAAAIPFTGSKVYPGMNLKQDVAKIEIPTLVVSGARDVVVPEYCQSDLSRALKHATLVSIENAGHFPFVTKSNEFKEAVVQWWKTAKGEVI